MTLQEAKEQVANKNEYDSFDEMITEAHINSEIVDFSPYHIHDQVAELYAQSAAQEAREAAIDDCVSIIDDNDYRLNSLRDHEEVRANLLNLKEKKCQCSFAMIRRDQETQKAYCFECKKEIEE